MMVRAGSIPVRRLLLACACYKMASCRRRLDDNLCFFDNILKLNRKIEKWGGIACHGIVTVPSRLWRNAALNCRNARRLTVATILIVEDEADIRELVRFHLEREGYAVLEAADGPDGLEKALSALRRNCAGRLICVFGCGGNRDAQKRPVMGAVAARLADFTVLTSDNPRYEDPFDIIPQIEEGMRPLTQEYVIVVDRESAIGYALDMLRQGDVLLIAGKGGERYQEIMGVRHIYSDIAAVRDMLGGGAEEDED